MRYLILFAFCSLLSFLRIETTEKILKLFYFIGVFIVSYLSYLSMTLPSIQNGIFVSFTLFLFTFFSVDEIGKRIKFVLIIHAFDFNTVFSLLNALGIYIFFLILGWASIGEGR